jgi:hypothetical protein
LAGSHASAIHVPILLYACLTAGLFVASSVNVFAQGTLMPTPQNFLMPPEPLNNRKICTYAPTSTPLATYSDSTLSTPNANPIRTNSAGRPTTGGVYFSATTYKILILTAGSDGTCNTGTTVYSQDNIPAVPATAVGLDVTGTAGEALAAGDVVYLSDGSGALLQGRWYKADADNTYSSSTAAMVGIVPSAIASGESGSIRIGGRITGLSGLTAGELYYASATAGALTATPPTNQWNVGKADTTTSLLLEQNQGGVRLPDSDGTHSAVVRLTQNLTADRLWSMTWGDAALTTNFSPGTAGTFLRSDATNWAGSTLVLPNAATANQVCYASATNTIGCGNAALTFDGTDVVTTGDLSLGGGDLIATANTILRRNTTDGADNGVVSIGGGGGGFGAPSRGASLGAYGNEGSEPGRVVAYMGNVANASYKIVGNNGGTVYFDLLEANGRLDVLGVYNETDAGAANVFVDTDGSLRRSTSSARYKDLHGPLPDWRWFLRLTPQLFSTKGNTTGRRYGGFLAEDVARVGPRSPDGRPIFAGLDASGRPDDVAYPHLTAVIQQGLVEHDRHIADQRTLIAELLARIETLERETATLRATKGSSR